MNLKTYKIKSPAKINIGLYIKNKRRDGYHNIETIFYPVKSYDELKVRIGEIDLRENKITIKTNPEIGIDEKENICYKAVNLFFEEFRIKKRFKVEIEIKKRIPIGAGLGGGSSDAAAVLKVLAKHFKIQTGKLPKTALKLGSDVPFFLLGKPAYAASRGEKLTILPKFKVNYKILIVKPAVHVSTKWAYDSLNIKKQRAKIKNKQGKSLSDIKRFDLKDTDIFRNDFEGVVFKKYTAIRKIKEGMYKKGAVFSSMSGSGSAVYGFFERTKQLPRKL